MGKPRNLDIMQRLRLILLCPHSGVPVFRNRLCLHPLQQSPVSLVRSNNGMTRTRCYPIYVHLPVLQ